MLYVFSGGAAAASSETRQSEAHITGIVLTQIKCRFDEKLSPPPDVSCMKRPLSCTFLMLLADLAAAQPALHLKTWKPEAAGAGGVLDSPLKRRTLNRYHLVVQFAGAPADSQLDELRNRGVTVLSSVPDFGFAISAGDS